MRPYRERIVRVSPEGGELHLDMVPVPGGEFLMGSPEGEPGRGELESPRRRVRVGAFWMATHETTWDLYRVFMFDTDRGGDEPAAAWADAVSRPTPPYRPMDFGMGVEGFPAISMTQFAARHFTKWLSMKTGRFYRLPTEAEWEYACRAGAGSAWSFGDDPAAIDRFAWHAGNSERRYREVARLEPNAWGLFDLHGNVAEWTLDAYADYSDARRRRSTHRPARLAWERSTRAASAAAPGGTSRPLFAAQLAEDRNSPGSGWTRSSRRASGTTRTRGSWAFASSGRWSSRRSRNRSGTGRPTWTRCEANRRAPAARRARLKSLLRHLYRELQRRMRLWRHDGVEDGEGQFEVGTVLPGHAEFHRFDAAAR